LKIGRLDTELLGVLGVQALPAAELDRIRADDAPERRASDEVIEHVQADVPAGGTPRDVTVIDVVKER
jgi:hypothetical protein